MKIIDLFSGAGGMSMGFHLAGYESELAIEINEDAIETFNRNIAPVAKSIDIKKLTNAQIKKYFGIDGVIGGPPCQGFSMAGKRLEEDDRNNLYIDFIRVVNVTKPKFFVMENVKGLLSMLDGKYKDEILKRFENMGYDVQIRVLKASDYGVPQNRERVFFIGFRKEYKINCDFFPNPTKSKVTVFDALSDLPLDKHLDFFKYVTAPLNSFQKIMRKDSSKTIFNNERTKHTPETIKIISHVKDGGSRKDLPKEFFNVRNFNASFNRMNSNGQSRTIDTGHRNYFHYCDNRIPTVRESARIQSFPDNFIFSGSRTSQYRQVGNAVPPLLAFAIAENIKKILEKANI